MFGRDKKKAIRELTEWLSHSSEYGEAPDRVEHIRKYSATLLGFGKTDIHLLRYRMPEGATGRGFVNPITWSFLGEAINAIDDAQLVRAYCGWAWLFPSVQGGAVVTDFESRGEEGRFLEARQAEGFENPRIEARYRIVTSEVFEARAERDGKEWRIAGDGDQRVAFASDDPRFALNPIYFFLGDQVIQG